METGKLIESYREIEAEWGQLAETLQNGDYAPYHMRIKALFKDEFALRSGQPVLPESKPILELWNKKSDPGSGAAFSVPETNNRLIPIN